MQMELVTPLRILQLHIATNMPPVRGDRQGGLGTGAPEAHAPGVVLVGLVGDVAGVQGEGERVPRVVRPLKLGQLDKHGGVQNLPVQTHSQPRLNGDKTKSVCPSVSSWSASRAARVP